MFTLQRLNVVRVVATETERDNLIDDGFKDITPKAENTTENAEEAKPAEPPKTADNKDKSKK